MGDGDCVAIGGNHLIHAARRNIDVTAVVFNNSIYGMTGGQMSPTTFEGDVSTTSVYGNVEQAFDICELARAAGATYVARGTSYNYQRLAQLIAGGIAHKGFSFVEAMVACPTYYGRQNGIPDPADMLKMQKARAVPVEQFDSEGPRLRDRYPVGVLHHAERERVHGRLRRRRAPRPGGAPWLSAVARRTAAERRGRPPRDPLLGLRRPGHHPGGHAAGRRRGGQRPRGHRHAELRPRGPRRRLEGRGHRLRRRDRLSRGDGAGHHRLPLAGGLRRLRRPHRARRPRGLRRPARAPGAAAAAPPRRPAVHRARRDRARQGHRRQHRHARRRLRSSAGWSTPTPWPTPCAAACRRKIVELNLKALQLGHDYAVRLRAPRGAPGPTGRARSA